MAADMFALLLCFTVFMLVPVSNISAKAFSDFFFYYISFLNYEFLIPVFKFCPLEKFKLKTYWLAAPVPGGGTSCLPKGALPTRAGSWLRIKKKKKKTYWLAWIFLLFLDPVNGSCASKFALLHLSLDF